MVSIFVTSTITSTSSSCCQSHAVFIIDNNDDDDHKEEFVLHRPLPLCQLSNHDRLLPTETATIVLLKRL